MKEQIDIKKFYKEHGKQAIIKLYDFLLSEISEDTVDQTIDFVMCREGEEKDILQDDLYIGDKYKGILCEGNQYLIQKLEDKILVIDAIAEEHCSNYNNTRFEMSKKQFIEVIKNKNNILSIIKEIIGTGAVSGENTK